MRLIDPEGIPVEVYVGGCIDDRQRLMPGVACQELVKERTGETASNGLDLIGGPIERPQAGLEQRTVGNWSWVAFGASRLEDAPWPNTSPLLAFRLPLTRRNVVPAEYSFPLAD